MIVSLPKSSQSFQPTLFPELLGNHGHRRTVIGNFIQRLTVVFFKGKEHRCYGADYCPDVSVGDNYFECKAMGRTDQTLVYEGRLYKDIKFAEGHKLFYVIWKHRVDTLKHETVISLQFALLQSLEYCAVVPFDVIENYCLWTAPKRLNSNYGGKKNPSSLKLYGSGYRIPGSIIRPWILFSCEAS